MPSLPDAIVALLSPFASLFDAHTWRKVQILLTEVILAPGRRTVSTALYVLGLQERGDFALFHHVLSRVSWSSLAVSRVLLERRWGETRPWGCIGTRSAPPTATSSRPRGCAGSA